MLQTELYQSSVGKKVVMAVSGLILLGFVIGHLAGNLLVFCGPDALNAYAKKLRDLGALLWVVRVFLIGVVCAHIGTAIVLAVENKLARPINYEIKKSIQNSYAARTMMFSGIIVLAFLVYHLLHFTFLMTHPLISHLVDSEGRHDVYSMVVLSFQRFNLSLFYIISMALLCLHLSHGFSSLFQSLGLNDEKWNPCFERASLIIALVIFVGYVSIPISILSGVIR